MESGTFDPNAFILPSSREERRRLANATAHRDKRKREDKKPAPSKRVSRKRIQLQKKKETTEVQSSVLQALQEYRLPEEIASQLHSTSRQSRRAKKSSQSQRNFPRRETTNDSETESSDEDCSNGITVTGVPEKRENPTTQSDDVNETRSNGPATTDATFNLSADTDSHLSSTSKTPDRRGDAFLLRKHVTVDRSLDIEKQRQQLPAVTMEQEIVEMVLDNDIVLLTGATGCGKSTQVPQFLYEAGLCGENNSRLIGITQPRRVAVTSLATRVGVEMNDPALCGYQIRYDSAMNERCCLKFMTDGILLREMQHDFLCSRYSVFILDEAHERSVNCDILLGLLSRAVALRRDRFNKGVGELGPLRLVIMSATLRLSDFTENRHLFPVPPPVIDIPARTYPVTLHFARITPTANRIHRVAAKAVEIHRKLPAGSILVFMSGRGEVHAVCSAISNRLQHAIDEEDDADDSKPQSGAEDRISCRNEEEDFTDEDAGQEDTVDDSSITQSVSDRLHVDHPKNRNDSSQSNNLCKGLSPITTSPDTDVFCLDGEEEASDFQGSGDPNKTVKRLLLETTFTSPMRRDCSSEGSDEQTVVQSTPDAYTAAALGFDSGIGMGTVNPKQNLDGNTKWLGYGANSKAQNNLETCRVRIVPLYALLPIKEQAKAFERPGENERVIIVATNVAETSLTLPNIRYVVDSGKEKKRRPTTSRSDAASVFSVQWISKASADQRAGRAGRVGPGHCYRLYSSAVYTDIFPAFPVINLFISPLDSVLLFMASIGVPNVDTFPFPTPPPKQAVNRARELLLQLGAFERMDGGNTSTCSYRISTLGRLMSQFPLSPRFALSLISALSRARADATALDLVPACCSVAAGWTVGHFMLPSAFCKPASTSGAKHAVPGWSGCTSDAELTWWMLSHYIRTPNKDKFCTSNQANQKQLAEAAVLYEQLLREIRRKIDLHLPIEMWISRPPVPCSASLVSQLHDCLLLGLMDNVCVRHDVLPQAQKTHFKNGGYLWSGLQPGLDIQKGIQHRVLVHRSSALYDLRPRPSFLAFSQLLTVEDDEDGCSTNQTIKKHFLQQCFPVDPALLAAAQSPLILHSSVLTYPSPVYLPKEDRVVGFVKATYAPLDVSLPPTRISLKNDNELCYRVFARAFLEGEVLPDLKKLHSPKASYLRFHPSWVVLSGGKHDAQDPGSIKKHSALVVPHLTSELQNFVEALKLRQCASRATLQSIWSKEPNYLLSEFRPLVSATCPKAVSNPVFSQWGKMRAV